ncbi:uncharacterized protein K460DRAFT_66417 [Cucurbitaria berberidis CBS 394.84]|uniref:Uncharacterized protein n=1 Tax=Cucurbitaria berberidis CBS 394.84 TaxID=1168544 RepID=A0A9P4GMY4_9PLEO|nr:uncharacterized protein K460DRAFT_66417 [Cucurbitaria berberidis CBS 394.84]KAF1847975.1 hypothetical protein K460DRAFT_66417 [Cucurbitaria berberidis CBS 394.84]
MVQLVHHDFCPDKLSKWMPRKELHCLIVLLGIWSLLSLSRNDNWHCWLRNSTWTKFQSYTCPMVIIHCTSINHQSHYLYLDITGLIHYLAQS